jgi:hypothetical protein
MFTLEYPNLLQDIFCQFVNQFNAPHIIKEFLDVVIDLVGHINHECFPLGIIKSEKFIPWNLTEGGVNNDV